MRRSLIALTAGLLLALGAAFPVAAADMCDSGRDFGSMHISVEAAERRSRPGCPPGNAPRLLELRPLEPAASTRRALRKA